MPIKLKFNQDDFFIDIKESDVFSKSYSRKIYKKRFRKDKTMLPLEIIEKLVFQNSVAPQSIIEDVNVQNGFIGIFSYDEILEAAVDNNFVEQKTVITVLKKSEDNSKKVEILAIPHFKEEE